MVDANDALAAKNAEVKEEKKKKDIDLSELFASVAKKAQAKSADYRHLIRHTGSLVSGSMTVAYTKGVLDTLALLQKEISNGK